MTRVPGPVVRPSGRRLAAVLAAMALAAAVAGCDDHRACALIKADIATWTRHAQTADTAAGRAGALRRVAAYQEEWSDGGCDGGQA
jgi:hypothetical protein